MQPSRPITTIAILLALGGALMYLSLHVVRTTIWFLLFHWAGIAFLLNILTILIVVCLLRRFFRGRK